MTTEQTTPHPYSQVLQWVAEGKEIERRQALTAEWRSTDYDTVLICSIHGVKSDSYLQPQDFRLKPQRHVHQDLIDAFENGAKIEYRDDYSEDWTTTRAPAWGTDTQYRIKPERHVHQDLIDAWKNGAKIQWRNDSHGKWIDEHTPMFNTNSVYRIKPEPKPEPKPDFTEILSNTMRQGWVKVPTPVCFNENIKVTRCGETYKIKSVEII